MRKELHFSAGRWRVVLAAVVLAGASLWQPTSAAAQIPLVLENFSQAAPQGFGDVQNSMARASLWWQGKLYVGTSRSFACQQQAIQRLYNPSKPYPPPDTNITCTPNEEDLPLQAEIWRWTPDTVNPLGPGTWDMVYQSPNTIPFLSKDGVTNKTTAREVGFRDMVAFTEQDGTQALYITGISARSFIKSTVDANGILIPTLPPPTLLRSTDGVNWAPVPQDPGTVFGDLGVDVDARVTITSLNRIAAFNGKLYLIVGGDFGHGMLYEATNPEQGNNAWQKVSPAGMTFTYMVPFQNTLVLGQGAQPVNSNPPFKLVRMDTTTNPYTFPTVLDGTRLPSWNTSKGPKSVATMHVAGSALWVATNQPVELWRINPNFTADLFIGDSRQMTTGGTKAPRTGLGDSFGWSFNIHIHRIQDHAGFLYTATNDVSNFAPSNTNAAYDTLFNSRYGFDMHRTSNGWYFYPITLRGFEEKDNLENNWYNFTGRVAETTPYGMFIGTGNNQFGTQIWRAVGGTAVVQPPPTVLEVEKSGTKVVLSWLPSAGATGYRIFKASHQTRSKLGLSFVWAPHSQYPRPWVEIGSVGAATTTYTDTTPLELYSDYYVVADGPAGTSNPSNLVRASSLAPVTTFGVLTASINEWGANAWGPSFEVNPALTPTALTAISGAKSQAIANNFAGAIATLNGLKAGLGAAPPGSVAPWRLIDGAVLIDKMIRRLTLAQAGLIPSFSVKY